MRFIKIFVAALAIFGLQFTVASAASPVKKPGKFVSANSSLQQVPQEHRHHIMRHHLRHRPHRLRHK